MKIDKHGDFPRCEKFFRLFVTMAKSFGRELHFNLAKIEVAPIFVCNVYPIGLEALVDGAEVIVEQNDMRFLGGRAGSESGV